MGINAWACHAGISRQIGEGRIFQLFGTVFERLNGKRALRLVAVLLLFSGSAALLAQTVSRQDQIQVYYHRAARALNAHQDDEASKDFREIVKLDPENAEAYANLGLIDFNQHKLSDASGMFAKALKLKPGLWNARALLGICELELGHSKSGSAMLSSAFPHLTNREVRIEAGVDLIRIHMTTHTLNQVVGVVRELEKDDSDSPEASYVAYRAYSELAAEALKRLSTKWPNSALVHQVFAQADVTQDNFAQAIKQYKLAIKEDPSLPGAHYELGRTILVTSQSSEALDQAESNFRAELALNPWSADSEYELGEVYRLEMKLKRAEVHYEKALQINPEFGRAQSSLGETLMLLSEPARAIPHLEAAVRLEPESKTAHYRLSRAYAAIGEKEKSNGEMAIFLRLKK